MKSKGCLVPMALFLYRYKVTSERTARLQAELISLPQAFPHVLAWLTALGSTQTGVWDGVRAPRRPLFYKHRLAIAVGQLGRLCHSPLHPRYIRRTWRKCSSRKTGVRLCLTFHTRWPALLQLWSRYSLHALTVHEAGTAA